MYQVVINDKYYVSDVDVEAICTNDRCYITSFEAINNKYESKLFESKNMAQSIAEQIGGKVIEYVEQANFSINKQDVEDMMLFGVVKLR